MDAHPGTGRFAPSPSQALHLGNLRTAVAAWLDARSLGQRFLVRIDDLDPDRSRPELIGPQLADLARIGLDWDEEPLHQSRRGSIHAAAVTELRDRGLLYPCFCSRAEIRAAADAPHGPGPEGAYPGTCSTLGPAEAQARLRRGDRACWRLRADGRTARLQDRLLGTVERVVDDFVVVRADGVAAYNLATVVDDAASGVTSVVRGADLADTTPRQLVLHELLGTSPPSYAHVPLLLDHQGQRLSKRSGSVTIADLRSAGWDTDRIRSELLGSLGVPAQLRALPLKQIARGFRLETARDERIDWPLAQPEG